jgi:hypothetical protein
MSHAPLCFTPPAREDTMSETSVTINVNGNAVTIVDVVGHVDGGTGSVQLYLASSQMRALARLFQAAAEENDGVKGPSYSGSNWTAELA